MKKLYILSILFIITTFCYSQVIVEDVNINDLDIQYIEIIGYNKSLLGQKMIITVDYGQKFKLGQSQVIKDSQSNIVIFNSMTHALNFMAKNGWQYINNYAVSAGTSSIYYYLLKKK